MLLTVTVVMFEIVALIFQGVKRLVLNMPSAAAIPVTSIKSLQQQGLQ
ncbi:hypothetical protein [Endozoicomonas sp. Mp262]